MSDQEPENIRAKQIGVLLRYARLSTGKSMKEVGKLIGVSGSTISAYENGDKTPSLPELETFAYIYEIPIEHLLGKSKISDEDGRKRNINWKQMLQLRDRIIGARLCQARMDKGKSLNEMAQVIDVSPRVLRSIELGNRSISLPHLETLIGALNLSLSDFIIGEGVIGEWLVKQRALMNFDLLPVNLQEFVTTPINQPYLEIAQKLSEMSTEKLRAVAEGLLEITL